VAPWDVESVVGAVVAVGTTLGREEDGVELVPELAGDTPPASETWDAVNWHAAASEAISKLEAILANAARQIGLPVFLLLDTGFIRSIPTSLISVKH